MSSHAGATAATPGQPDISRTRTAGLSTDPVPMEPYRSREHYALEQERIFRRCWLMVGRVEEIPSAGDFVRKEIEVCGTSILIARAKDGSIRAFHNVCSHRGNLVVLEESGNASRFVCRYHNWTYANDGRLIGVPDEKSFFDLDKSKCGLSRVACEIWEGWIFINLATSPEVTLAEFMGTFAKFLSGIEYQFAAHPLIVQAKLDCNWKVVSDAFSESYHIPAIHPATIGATFSSRTNPFAHLLDTQFFGPHRFVSMYGNSGYRPEESHKVEILAFGAPESGSVIAAATEDGSGNFLKHPSINPTRSRDWAMDVNHLWPNTHIDTGPGGFWTHQFWPTAYNQTRHEVRFYAPPATTARQRFQQEVYMARVIEILLEDLSNVARVQCGLESRGKDFMQIQDNEVLIRHQSEHVAKWVAAKSVREALNCASHEAAERPAASSAQ
jgi:phenylpropionate dioxygenase-like ring-hydroxylating dioxygenase large terminal subunit